MKASHVSRYLKEVSHVTGRKPSQPDGKCKVPGGRNMVGKDTGWSNLASYFTRLNVNRLPTGLSASTNTPFSILPLPILCIAATMVL